MVGNFSGIAAPIITGLVVDWSGSFAGAFLVAAGLSAIGVIVLVYWSCNQIRPIEWALSRCAVARSAVPAAVLA